MTFKEFIQFSIASIIILLLCASYSYAQNSTIQNTNFESNQNWRFHRKEVIVGLGVSQFLGDLGGKDQVGTDYSLKDLELALTQPAIQLGFRYRLANHFATRTTLNFGILKGDDKLTAEVYRHNRNLNFKSIILELGQYIEINLFVNEKIGKRNSIKGVKGASRHSEILYVFSGITGFYFNPKGTHNGQTVALQPLGTEGQGLPGGPEKYGKFNFAIPFGIGFKWAIGSKWRMAIEASYNKTFTDYMDDVSGNYYDNSAILSQRGPTAALFADPSVGDNPNWTVSGEQRGDPDNKDAYFYATVQFIYDFTYNTTRVNWGNGRTSRRSTVKAKF